MDAGVVGGAFLSASLQVLFDRMASRDVLAFLQGNKPSDLLPKKLKIKLLAVQSVLNHAEAKQIKNSAVKEWVDELKDVVYDAEDLLDDIATEALRCKMEAESQNQVRNFISALVNPFVEGIKSRVKEIIDVLELLEQQKDALGLKEGVGEKLSERLPATSLVNESGVYGRDGKKKEIVQLLLSDNASGRDVGVIALVGMGGIGKTTLANLIYRDESVKESFELKAWVCVSDEFDVIRVTKTILRTLDPTAPDENDLNLLQLKLQERLNGKKFLLVLDDVWNENYNSWDMLQTPFAVGLNGSKIIVTTRSKNVASVMRSDHTHCIEELSFDDCWSLFARHAFRDGADSNPNPKLEEIGKEIVKKCKGLPLAAKTLGAALYSETRVKNWENILNSEIWDLENDDIIPALRLSYDHLPSQLKRCFAYCSIFPKDYEIEKEKLILLWMAEGFLEQSKGKRMMEELGYNYFDELLSRSFFQKSLSGNSYFGMHDLINDLAQFVSGKFCHQLKDGKLHEIPEKLRHFSNFRSEFDLSNRFEFLNNVNGLRTFLPVNFGYLPDLNDEVSDNRFEYSPECSPEFHLGNRVLNDFLSKAQYLRVFSLSYYDIVNLPDAIGNLMHLRYLDLSYTSIRRLPDSICNLYNLQTLILTCCGNLVELPVMMSKLISLRYLDIRHSKVKEMPSQMGELESLRKLTNYRVGQKSGTGIGELRKLSNLSGSLRIQDLQVVVDGREASEANLAGKQYLDDLWLVWKMDIRRPENNNGADAVLHNLRPHSNLKTLTIQWYRGSRFPDWLGGPETLIHMVSLRLWNCRNVSVFPPLGQLPCLEHLYISGAMKVERVGAEFYGTTGSSSTSKPSFVSLKALSFHNMPKWKEWVCVGGEGGEFPRLKELYIEHCPELSGELPVHVQLLTELNIIGCGGLFLRRPSSEFKYLGRMGTSNMPQWKELPPLLKALRFEMVDSVECLLEDGLLQSNNCLEELQIESCSFARTLARVCLPSRLSSLFIVDVGNVEFLLHELFKCSSDSLRNLTVCDSTCGSLSCFPLGNFPELYSLWILGLRGLESLAFSISEEDPTSLRYLQIDRCPNLVSIELPALNLLEYSIRNCSNLKSLKHNAACSFGSLKIADCPQLIFPIQGRPSSNLTSLSISKCNKVTSETELGLQQLTSLEKLKIRDCPNLQSLAVESLPTSLTTLTIHNCPLLKDKCRFGRSGHRIPHILIDGQLLE